MNIRATDTVGNTSDQIVNIKILDVIEQADFIGERTNTNVAIAVNENTTAVNTFSAEGDVTWSLNGGADEDQFAINTNTGEMVLISTPDFEIPQDTDKDNNYVVVVRAQDAQNNIVDQTVTVSINDIDEIAPIIQGQDGNNG